MKKHRTVKKPVAVEELMPKRDLLNSTKLKETVSKIEKSGEQTLDGILVSEDINENRKKLEGVFKNCQDAVFRDFTVGSIPVNCFVIYLDVLVEKDYINNNLLRPLMMDVRVVDTKKPIAGKELAESLNSGIISVGTSEAVNSISEVVKKIMVGYSCLFVDGSPFAIGVDTYGTNMRPVGETIVEAVMRGPQEGFVEALPTCLSQLRRRLRTPELKLEMFELGKLSKTYVAALYIDGLVDKEVLKELKSRLSRIDTDIIIESGYVEAFIEDNPASVFPQVDITERPDKCVIALSEGRIIILVDGTPFALIVPIVFTDFLSAPEDNYHRFYFAFTIKILRYLAFIIAFLAPSLYIAITTYHQEMIPANLVITLQSYRAQVPFPAFVEAILMEFTFEVIREAGLRLPKSIASTLSIIGALVIGQVAVQAGIASPVLLVVVSLTGLCSFTIPSHDMGRAVRVIKYPIMFLAGSLGVYGIIIGILFVFIHMASLRSLGVPYLSPMSPMHTKNVIADVLKLPLWLSRKRPEYIQKNNSTRMKDNQKPGPEHQSGS